MHNSDKVRFIIRVIFAITPIICVLTICETLLRRFPNEYSYKNTWLTNNAKSVQILVLGPSYTRTGIEPNAFSLNTFDAAAPAQDFKYDCLILSKFIEQMDSLKYVILPVSYATIFHNLDSSSERDLTVNYVLGYHFKNKPFRLSNCFYLCRAGSFLEYLHNKKKKPTFATLGNGITNTSNSKPGWEANGQEIAKSHSVFDISGLYNEEILKMYSLNLDYARNIVQICGEYGVHVILLIAPTYKTYWENIDKKQYDMMLAFCKQLQKEYANISFLNMMKDERFTNKDFYDCHHLSADYGAAKLSTILNDFIMNTLEHKKQPPLFPSSKIPQKNCDHCCPLKVVDDF